MRVVSGMAGGSALRPGRHNLQDFFFDYSHEVGKPHHSQLS
jgi:hypothetical protein